MLSIETMQAGLAIAIFAILFSLGLGLSLTDFKKIFANLKALFLILGCQLLLLPGLALTITWLFQLTATPAFGLLLLAAAPGGVSSNVFTRLSGGHTALSAGLTTLNTLLAVVTIPTILFVRNWLIGGDTELVSIPFGFLTEQLLMVTFYP